MVEGQYLKTYKTRKCGMRKKAIVDMKSEVLGYLSGNVEQAFASSVEEEKYELDMCIFGRYQYRSNIDDVRVDERNQEKYNTKENKKWLIGSQVFQEQHKRNCVYKFFQLVLEEEVKEGKIKLETFNWT